MLPPHSIRSFDNLFLLVALCTFATLLPAPFLRLLPAEVDTDPDEGADAAGGKKGGAAEALETRALLEEAEKGGQSGFGQR